MPPLIQTLSTILQSHHKVFSVFNLQETFHQISMKEEASKLADIVTKFETFLLTTTPFGLKNVTAFLLLISCIYIQ